MLACCWASVAAVLITLIIAVAVCTVKAEHIEQDVKKTAMEHGYVEAINQWSVRYWTLPGELPKPELEKK